MYKGDESSPLGLGFSPKNLNAGTIKVGKDEKPYFVKETKTNKFWSKIDFNDLPQSSYETAFFPEIELLEKVEEETGLEDKFGGNKPFFMEGETWPTNKEGEKLTFICQFVYPFNSTKKELIRIFLPIDDDGYLSDFYSHITKISLNKKNLKNQIVIENKEIKTHRPIYLIKKWNEKKELKSLRFFSEKYGLDERSNEFEIITNSYDKSKYVPSFDDKVGGTPVFCQYMDGESKKHLFQFSESKAIPYTFGDSGIAHVFNDLEFYWDCY
jgi:uncharacterized protein YwqG